MKPNPCSKCKSSNIRVDAGTVSCATPECENSIKHSGSLQEAIDAWNFDNELPVPAICPLRWAFYDLMKRYAVDDKISDAANMPAYDREWLNRLTDIGVLSLCNGLYRPY